MSYCSSIATRKEKGNFFPWTDSSHIVFLEVLKEFQASNGYTCTFSWPIICNQFEIKTGEVITPKIARNKLRYLRTKWAAWTNLRTKVTGAGYDYSTGKITADDSWWEKQKEEDFYSFKKKPVSVEMSDLWDDIFGTIAASGKHVVAPSMDSNNAPVVQPTPQEEEVNSEDSLDQQLNIDRMDDLAQQSQQESQPTGSLSQPPDGVRAAAMQNKGKHANLVLETRTKNQKRSKSSLGASSYIESVALVGETSRRFLSIFENNFGSANKVASSNGEVMGFKEAYDELGKLVKAGLMVDKSKLWCYAVTELCKEERRLVFTVLDDDERRVAWLTHEFENR